MWLLPLILVLAASGSGVAQEPTSVLGLDPSIEETRPDDVGDAETTVADAVTLPGLLRSGGWAMWPLSAFSIAVIALAGYNLFTLRKTEFCPPALVENLRGHMSAFRLRSALAAAGGDGSYLGRMLTRSLPSIDATDQETLGRDAFQEAMGDFALRANGHYMLWVNYFSILAQAAPMLGLLGTVSGMIKAFSTMGREGMGDPTLLAGHISEALVTTACGLIIALPALFCYFVFRNRLTQLIGECVDTADELLDVALSATNPQHLAQRLPDGFTDPYAS